MIKKVRKYWNKAADSWNDFIISGKDHYKEFIIAPATMELLPAQSPKKCKALDLCCGEGYYSRLLKKKGYPVSGVDISDNLINIARKKDASIPYFSRDAGNLSIFPGNYFDLVICSVALMDTPNYKKIIKEAY